MSASLGELGRGEWLVHDLNAFELAQRAKRGTAKVREFTQAEPTNTDNRPTLIMRQGAIGDLLMLTPALAEFKTKNFSHPALCCWPKHFDLFGGNRDLGGLIPYPLPADQIPFFKRIISLENTMESDHSQHATDVFAKALGLSTPLPNYKPKYFVRDEEKEKVAQYLFKQRPNIVIQQRASVANRDYPLDQWLEVIVKLERRGWGVLLVGYKGQIPIIPRQYQSPFIRDLSRHDLTFREIASVLAQSQAFCGVDSAFAHLAHALDIPAVVLFGAFDWKTRTAHAPKTIAISGNGDCAPCSWHFHANQMFPPNKPCTAIQRCVVLAGIPPERIVSKISLIKP